MPGRRRQTSESLTGAGNLAPHRMPEGRGCEVHPADRDKADRGVYAFAAVVRPVHVLEVEQQRELVDDQGGATAVRRGGYRMPPVTLLPAQRDPTDTGQQGDPDVVVVKVLAAGADAATARAVPGPDPVRDSPGQPER